MTFLKSMNLRYTTKRYLAGEKIEKEKLEELKEILRLSPSSIDSQPWTFVFITNENLKERLSHVSMHNENKVRDCSCLVVFGVLNDVREFEKRMNQYLSAHSVEYYNRNVRSSGEETVKIWLSRQVYISLGVLLSACAEMGIDSTPMEGIETDRYKSIIGMEGYEILFAVALGTRDPQDANQPSFTPKSRLPMEKVVRSIE